MTRASALFAALILALTLSAPAFSKDCGEPPMNQPSVPEGAKATRDEITKARNDVIAFSSRIDAYIACMDERFGKLGPYMDKDQRARWSEDIKALADRRRELQIDINREIRAWRATQED